MNSNYKAALKQHAFLEYHNKDFELPNKSSNNLQSAVLFNAKDEYYNFNPNNQNTTPTNNLNAQANTNTSNVNLINPNTTSNWNNANSANTINTNRCIDEIQVTIAIKW